MKKFPLSISFAFVFCILTFLSPLTTRASHLMGGNIFVEHLQGLDYVVSITLYRDVNGIAMGAPLLLIDSAFGGPISNSYLQIPAPTLLPNGVERYAFVDTITFPHPGIFYKVSYSNCCRNAAILNMTTPSSETMELHTIVLVDPAAVNSSPVLLNEPVTLAQVGVPFNYNPLPFDIDGDSLSWTLTTPLGFNGLPIAGFFPAPGLAPVVINPLNGEITWTPNTLGNFVISVKVTEYRNGVYFGEILRDMQIIVVNGPTPNAPAFTNTGSWPQDQFGNFRMTANPNVPFTLVVTAEDPDGFGLLLSAEGEPFFLATSPAQFISSAIPNSQQTGTFTWIPDPSHERTPPYSVAFRLAKITAYTFFQDLTVLFDVASPTGTSSEEPGSFGFEIFPNPVQDQINISFFLDKATQVKISVLDLTGKEVGNLLNQRMNEGNIGLICRDFKVPSGIYLVKLETESGVIQTKKIWFD